MKKRVWGALGALLLLFVVGIAPASAQITIPYPNFQPDTDILSAEVNANFDAIGDDALNRTGGTMTGTLTSSSASLAGTWGGTPTFSGAITFSSTIAVTGVGTFTAAPVFSSTTASRMLSVDGSKGLVGAAVASSVLLNSLSDATGTGVAVFASSPTLTTPTIGAATATSIAIGANTLNTSEWANLDGQDQTVLTTSSPTFADITFSGGDLIASANAVFRRNTSDGSDSGATGITGGGSGSFTLATSVAQGAGLFLYGNEHATLPGQIILASGGTSGANGFQVLRNDGSTAMVNFNTSDGSGAFTSSKQTAAFAFHSTNTTDATGTQVLSVRTGAANASTSARLIQFLDGPGNGIGHVNINNNAVAYTTSSDERLKTFLGPTKYGLNTILAIAIQDFHWNSDEGKMLRTGVSAQQLYSVYPEAVSVGGDDPLTAGWSVDYGKLTAPIIKAIQELAARLTALEAQ